LTPRIVTINEKYCFTDVMTFCYFFAVLS